MIFFASASANQNDIVEKEVLRSGGRNIRVSRSGVEFEGDLAIGYNFAIHTHSATRLLSLIHRTDGVGSTDELYNKSLEIAWEEWITPEKTFAITETISDCHWITNSHFAALRFKDALVERIRTKFDGERPNVDRDNPDIVFHIHVSRDLVSWFVDFAGRNISKRGYRTEQTNAVMGEYLGATVLYRSPWYRELQEGKSPVLFDPFCGSGTICIEAALMATHTPPGLIHTERFAFFNLPIHDEEVWQDVFEKAENEITGTNCKFYAYDADPAAIEIAKRNAERAGFGNMIEFKVKDFKSLTEEETSAMLNAASSDNPPSATLSNGKTAQGGADESAPAEPHGYIVTDPPYGVRLDLSDRDLRDIYTSIGSKASTVFAGWNISILCADKTLLSYIDMKPNKTNVIINGGLECQIAHYYIFSKAERDEMRNRAKQKREERLSQPLTPGAEMALNRLKKNLSTIGKEMDRQGVSCYRLYDADMPEYSAAIDFYEGRWIVLSEYAAPKSIPEEDAERRLNELILATERATGVDLENIYVKKRERQKGAAQYNKYREPSSSHFYVIKENGHIFSANFQDYLDTGIFLDHRPIRRYIEEHSRDKRFLNLFSYTSTATVYAAAGGALSTVSVDASSTYLDWAMKNMAMNGFTTMNHFYYRNDSIAYLRENRDMFDLIFCDPPTFSNNKSRGTFDIQRDHGYLIRSCMKHLDRNGVLIFSTNYTRFKLFGELYDEFEIEDITEATIGDDFKRNSKIHKCYLIRHKKVLAKKAVRRGPAAESYSGTYEEKTFGNTASGNTSSRPAKAVPHKIYISAKPGQERKH